MVYSISGGGITINFQVIKGYASARIPCRECGKVRKRQITIEHTVSPFNKNEDGSVRTPREVHAQATKEAKEKMAKIEQEGIVCKTCEKSSGLSGEPSQ